MAQSAQVPMAVAPTAAEYVPGSQSEQVSAVSAPTASEYLPASQLSQAADPDVALNLPATQDEQSPLGPVKPALHSHDDRSVSEL
jgi:hypothetical protein